MVSFVMLLAVFFSLYGTMNLFHMNEFLSILIIYPISIFLIGIISFILFNNIWVGPSAACLVSIISMFIIFNKPFWIWIVVYVCICLLGSFIGKGCLFILNRTHQHS